ncbi:MAG: DNA topoisomerase (ATP-hydrolyzing) subunit B [Clostridia bacterium]|nr:DNA topoisomerase (ATP-hydrolyzing) subunit B [Clostridia bacterium]
MSTEKIEANYGADNIQVLEGLEAVRKRPGMYIGSTSERGLHHLVYEIVDNSIDEALAGYCKNILVDINPDNSITVTDDGRGIPVGINQKVGKPAVEVVFTILHAGGKFGGGGYKVSGGLHGVGASVVNALSTKLEVEVCNGENRYTQTYHRGVPKAALEKKEPTSKTGTKVTFWPDEEIFETTVFQFEILEKRLREQAFLNKGLRIVLTDKRQEEERVSEFIYEGGIKSFVEYINTDKEPLHPEVIYFEGKRENYEVEIAFQYTTSYSENLISFANNINTTEGGTHETGFKTAITRVINDYGRKYKILKDNDKALTGEDVREGLTVVISVKLVEAQFEGQTKTKLGNSEIRGFVDNIVSSNFEAVLEENPAIAKIILEKTMAASRAREAARKARELSRKSASGGSLPTKLKDCRDKQMKGTEIYIVEGDSAGGSANQGRDSKFQAILSLWGKMLNVEKARMDKVFGNDKLNPIILALGTGIGDEFNIEKLRYERVIIMADADVDGAHIRTLLLTFFFRYMRPLIDAGHIFLAQPPLYKISKGKKEMYAYNDDELKEALKEFGEDSKIQRYKGLGEMDPVQLWETTMDPAKRIMLQVTLEDAIEADKTFSLLMGDSVEPRREFIEKNAKYVTNLDV